MPLNVDVDHFRARVLQDALSEGTTAYWRRRARAFEDARPRPGDYPGRVTPEQLAEQDTRLAAIAEACRQRATIAEWARPEAIAPDVAAVIRKAAA